MNLFFSVDFLYRIRFHSRIIMPSCYFPESSVSNQSLSILIFYLGVDHTTKNSDKIWLTANAMEFNKFNGLMKRMAVRPILTTLTLRTRKRMIQTLNDKDISPSHMMQLSRNKNVQSINNYSHVSQEQKKSITRIFSGSTSIVQTKTHSLVKTTKSNAGSSRALSGYCVYG